MIRNGMRRGESTNDRDTRTQKNNKGLERESWSEVDLTRQIERRAGRDKTGGKNNRQRHKSNGDIRTRIQI